MTTAKKSIVKNREPEALATVPDNPMVLIQQAIESGLDAGHIEKLMDLQERWERNQAQKGFSAALAEFQRTCPPIKKGRKIDMGRGDGPMYASLDDIMKVISPILADCGLSVAFSATVNDAGSIVADCIVHYQLHAERSSVTLPVPSNMRVNDTQKMGAALSYAKRYALCAALNIVVTDEDDDAYGQIETLDEEQAAEIDRMLVESGADVPKFKRWAGIRDGGTIADMPVGKYEQAVKLLRDKLKDKDDS